MIRFKKIEPVIKKQGELSMKIQYFKDQKHEENFYSLLEQAELLGLEKRGERFESLSEQMKILHFEDNIEKKQVAFLYLIALYQDDFITYEGMPFYVEVYEEISLDGPVYLLDEKVGKPTYEHEWGVYYGKKILQNERINLEEVPKNMKKFVENAMKMCGLV